MKNAKNIFLLFTFNLVLGGCSALGEESGYWGIRVAAPEHYDMWVTDAYLEKSGVRSWRAPFGGHTGCCWAGAYGPAGSGGELKPFPNLMLLRWFSFAEQKYYAALIRVPEDLQERMLEPVPYLYPDASSGQEPRRTLVLGLAPGGEVVVWIMSQRTNAEEVLRVSAAELPGDPEDFEELTESYLEEHGAYLKAHGVPLEGW
ncbi:hypothetical protein DOQ08_03076 [Marinobacter litoralis]|uniref:DUF2931 domain-containing protein n=1 Tax=Marinobacter litoralis TaxID=187981 RepID=A0A3M2R953_9GAMM|nr:DUF2931 family protein [Marinobacter litoralis]RMJ01797.1 hypothetical protein DOQ08_03076 [Marinobacter litoralis]